MNKTGKAIAFSIALHAVLLTALALLRPSLDPGTGVSPRYMEIAIVDGTGPRETGDTAQETERTVAAEGSRFALPKATPAPAPAPAPAHNPEIAVDPTDRNTLAATERPPRRERPPLEPQPADAGMTPASPPPATVEPMPGTTAPLPPRPRPLPVEQVPAVVTTLPELPVTETIARGEADLLETRVEDWAESFAALGAWQTQTRWEDNDRQYEATLSHVPSGDDSGYDEAVVTISTTRDGRTLATEVRMRRLGFSHFAQFIDRWDPDVQIHDDEIDGRFHSNSDIFIQRSRGVQPTFLGKVTTARSINTSQSDRRVDRDEVFLGGIETRVDRISLPARVALFGDDEPPLEHILRVARDTHLRFTDDGAVVWSPALSRREARAAEDGDAALAAGTSGRATLPSDAPYYVIAAEDAKLHVSGVVDGRVLVYSPEDIVVEGDLIYAARPADGGASDDYLGLVSERDIAIAAPEVTGPGDLEIHAAIYARSRFAVRGFRSRPSGELIVFGSITAGSLTATEPRFSTRLVFDDRLLKLRPPRFPVTDRYEITDWDGLWAVQP